MSAIATRAVPTRARLMLEQQAVDPLLARLFAARGVSDASQLRADLKHLLPPSSLTNAAAAARLLADALAANQTLLVVADYDCDGATACAVALRGIRALWPGATIDYLVPDRFKFGYGLTPEIVALALRHPRVGKPDWLITVDNGIASVAGVAAARAAGVNVLVTDHHLPGDTLPDANCIVNPNQPGCGFASKALAGVGVMFYVLLALRAELRSRGAFKERPEPNLATLLDLVALGTVADVVKLDSNNRILVARGLERIRAGKAHAGVAALLRVAAREARTATTFDFGFAAGPRLNAAGRLDDMSLGIECLLTDDMGHALSLAQQLDTLNRERRSLEAEMQDQALAALAAIPLAQDQPPERISAEVDAHAHTIQTAYTIALFDESWHQGVVGIVAARLKDRAHRPTIVFAPDSDPRLIKGSGRSIPTLHLRDCLDLVSKRHPSLLHKFGGHAMAAGLTLARADFVTFVAAFEAAARSMLNPADLQQTLLTDGALENAYVTLPHAQTLQAQVWGQGFAPPLFADTFRVRAQRLIKEKHLKLTLEKGGQTFEAIQFNTPEALQVAPREILAAYELSVDEYQGVSRVTLHVRHWEPALA